MDVRRIGPVGAEVADLDLASLDGPADFAALRALWLEHGLLVFRDQQLTPGGLAEFAAGFGELDVYPFRPALDGHPHVTAIVKEAHERANFGAGWHTDGSWKPCPPSATVLHAVELPPAGGDTLFADASAAWRDLPAEQREALADLRGVYTPALIHAEGGAHAAVAAGRSGVETDADRALAESEVEHPLIRCHPETAAPSIFCTPVHTHRIVGRTREESLPILEGLMAHATQPRYLTRLVWRPGTVAIWDDRRLFHDAQNDYHGHRREMWRVIVRGDRPR